ncbi:hypothetical protein [Bosea sp. MMO-172]|uniref:hypothetical protein n=1 Tax=Bosea sp. MMO-172 TaxID=3127885 RepID=UPI003017033C
MSRFFAQRPAPSDASAISALLAKDELRRLDEKRERLKQIIADIAPRRSSIIEGQLKALTKQRVGLVAAIARTGR